MSHGATSRDMSVGNPYTALLRFALTVSLTQFFQQLYNTADSLIVGRVLGKEALAAVSASSQLILLMLGFITGTSLGAGAVISRYFGARDRQALERAIHTIIAFGLIAGSILTVVGVVFSPTILRWMQVDPAVLPDSISYFRFYFMGILSTVLYNVFAGILNAVGDSRSPLRYLALASVLNVLLDLVLIAGLHKGVKYAAIATIISQSCSALLCLRHLMEPDTPYQVILRHIRIDLPFLGEIFRNGLPTGVQNSVVGLANVIVQSNINVFGADAMAACGAFAKIEGFEFLPITSFSLALTTFVGQNLGAQRPDRVRQGARFGILTSVTAAELIGVVTYLAAPQLIALFNDSPEVVRIGVLRCHIQALFFFLLAFSHCVAGIFRGAGHAGLSMMVLLSSWCFLRTIYIGAVTHITNEIGHIFWAYPVTWSISSLIFLVCYLKLDWMSPARTKPKA